MHDFKFKKNELFCEDVRVNDVAEKIGTPFYLYSYKTLTDHFLKIQKAFKKLNPIICFALKANDNLSIIKALVDKGAGCDIVSGGELKKSLMAGADPKKIVFASVGKSDEEIIAGLKAGILFFNVESEGELIEINRIAASFGKKAPVALRINPDVDASTHEKITTGTLKNKFGIDCETALHIFKNQKRFPHVAFKGIHIHIGSQITTSQPYVTAIRKVAQFIKTLKAAKISIEYLDIGGGLGIIYKDEIPQTAKVFADVVLPILSELNCKIIMEPGRFIVGNAGIFVTKVLFLKDNGFKKFLIVDGGMNDLMRPSLYNAYHEITPILKSKAKKIKVDVVGPICESGDFFGKDRALPKCNKGDLLAIMSAGAYGHVMSSNYNVRCRVPEVLVSGDKFELIRRRETFKDLIQTEIIPKFLKS